MLWHGDDQKALDAARLVLKEIHHVIGGDAFGFEARFGHIAEAEDVAEAVYAAVARLRFSTGDIIAVDGRRPRG